ncbi:unnamed protein product [Spirodela intermedia]|uniref:Uncharacterized protein n=2 Tax=Spirodela intermedia TaxID=51605 RepID=A0A7I8JCY6_SPIIN|nr:unnamed protein product [Spirodela intermedia]CAA6668007.1 unnamed protein product [Spirodela intermedia]CAA7404832.1 unnamed protein product [Spirodela intermedia]
MMLEPLYVFLPYSICFSMHEILYRSFSISVESLIFK